MAETLTSLVSAEDIHKILLSISSGKTPGPHRYTKEFFIASWSVVGLDFVYAVQSFFQNGFMLTGVNGTVLTLIPKKDDPQEIKDYRPISCCSTIYKVISKILVNRVKTILTEAMMPNQSAFIKDRLLLENVLLATKLVKDYHEYTIAP